MASLSSTFERLHTELAEALIACRANPKKRAVHTLRTTSRRIEALLRKVLKDHPQSKRLRNKAEKTLDQLKKLRKAAGPVRDLDVQRKLVAQIVETYRTELVEQRTKLKREGKELDRLLQQRRKQSAEKLSTVLKSVEPKLERALEHIPDAIRNLNEPSALKSAKSLLLGNSLNLRNVSGEALHSYRKHTKTARYLAEMQETSVEARRLAKRLKKMLDDIGRWHDLMLLKQEAKAVLGKPASLTEAIKAERNRAWKVAIRSAGKIHSTQHP